MKYILIFFITLYKLSSVVCYAQNTFPATGNVGIGTTSPSNKLTVEGQIEAGPLLLKAWSQSPYANSSWIRGMSDVGVFLTNNNVTRWAGLKADGSFDVSSGMLFVDGSTGNIGIGTTNIGNGKLTISGTDLNLLRLENETLSGESVLRFRSKAYTGNYLHADISLYADGGYLGIKIPHENSAGVGYQLVVKSNGNIGIGTTVPSEKLSVNGNIRAKKVMISQTGWPDYVFDSSYTLKPLNELESFIAKHKHLPDIPSAKEVAEKGISVGDQQALLLKKIEELTLYIIQQEARIKALEKSKKNNSDNF